MGKGNEQLGRLDGLIWNSETARKKGGIMSECNSSQHFLGISFSTGICQEHANDNFLNDEIRKPALLSYPIPMN